MGCASPIVAFGRTQSGKVWFAHQSGTFAEYDTESEELEVIGEQEGGVSAAAWSPGKCSFSGNHSGNSIVL